MTQPPGPPQHPWQQPWPPHNQAPPPQGPPHWGQPPEPPRRKRARNGIVAALVVAGAALMGGGVVALAMASSHNATGQPAPGTGASPTSTRAATSTEPSTEPSSTAPTTTAAGEPTGLRAPAGSSGHPVIALGDNPINIEGNGATSTPCHVPEFGTGVAEQDRFYQALIPCLTDAWEPALREAGLPDEIPRVVTTGADTNTACGLRRWNQTALYCPDDHTIYMTARYYSEVENRTRGGVYLGQFAHEFGHAVQALAGINTAYGDALSRAGAETPEGLGLTRRSELQATCFEGMTLAALQNGGLSNELVFPALRDSSLRGDEHSEIPDHGSTETNATWVDQGFTKNRVTQCNTWLSPESDVD